MKGEALWKASPTFTKERPPFVPDGWRFEPSRDGIGVLGPQAAFAPYDIKLGSQDELDKCLNATKTALAQDYPATALLLARDTMFYHGDWSDEVVVEPIIQSYQALGRPLLAQLLQRHLTYYQEHPDY